MTCGVTYSDCNRKEKSIYWNFVVANTLFIHMFYIKNPYFNKERVNAAKLYLNNGNGTFTFELPDVKFNESGVFNLYFLIYNGGEASILTNLTITLDVQGQILM